MALEPAQIYAIAQERSRSFGPDQKRWNLLADVYNGDIRKHYPDEFREGEVAKIANFIRRSWDMFARLVGKVPDIESIPLSLSSQDMDRKDKIEKICFAYNRIWDLKRKVNIMAHYYVGFGAVGVGIVPNPKIGSPQLLVEDPRNVLPGAGWESTGTAGVSGAFFGGFNEWQSNELGSTLHDCIVRKYFTGPQLLALYPNNSQLAKHVSENPNSRYTVLVYYEANYYAIVLDNILLDEGDHGVPWCPWQFPISFAPNRATGSSMFESQIGLEVAFMRILDQKLALNDSVTWPWLFQKGTVETYPDRRLMVGGSPDADVEVISPPPTFQVDRDLNLLRGLMMLMNFETEASQGDVSGGPITGRGVVELGKVTVETVQSFFDDWSFYFPKLYTTALVMDRELYGDEKKTLSAWGRGETFLEEYTPSSDIGDRFGEVRVEFGPGIGGFEGHLQMLQSLGAEAISLESVMSHNPHIRSLHTERRRIEREKLSKLLIDSSLTGQAAVAPEWIAQAIEALDNGQELKDFILKNPPQQATQAAEEVPPVLPGGEEIPGAGPAPATVQAPPLEALLGVNQ